MQITYVTWLIAENKEKLQWLFDVEEESREKLNSKKAEVMVSITTMNVHGSTSLSTGINSSKVINSNPKVLSYQVMDVTTLKLHQE